MTQRLGAVGLALVVLASCGGITVLQPLSLMQQPAALRPAFLPAPPPRLLARAAALDGPDAPATTEPPVEVIAATCPMAAPPDAVVSCPGWGEMVCRLRDPRGKVIRSVARKRMLFRRSGRWPKAGFKVEHVYSLACGGCDVPWNMLWVTDELWMEKRGWELKVCGLRK